MTPEMLAALKAEIANDPMKRGYAGQKPDVIAALLNAEYNIVTPGTTLTGQPFPWAAAKGIARGAPTMDWSRIVVRSAQRANVVLPPAGQALDPASAAILVAVNATESQDSDMIDPAHKEGWAAFEQGLGLLQMVGDLSSATVAAIVALGEVVVPDTVVPHTSQQHVVLRDFDGAPEAVTADDVAKAMGI